jgi:hypothetical protein
MPPHHKHDKKHPHLHVPSSKALRFLDRDRLDRLLATLVTNEGDRRFVARCLVDEGPLHHRGANYLLLALLAEALERVPGSDAPLEGSAVPMRLPPHLEDEIEDGEYPLPLATRALSTVVGDDEKALDAAIDCLTDGPPQHALANVVMVALLERLLARLEARR